VAIVNSTIDTLRKKLGLKRQDRAWFSRLLRHTARKRSRSILTTPEPAPGSSCSSTKVIAFRCTVWLPQLTVSVNISQMVAGMGVVLNGANLYGYVRCKMGSPKNMKGAASNFLGQQVLGSVSITGS